MSGHFVKLRNSITSSIEEESRSWITKQRVLYNRINNQKDIPVIVYCHSGSRSAYCQRIMLDLGFKSVTNLDYGISSFGGERESGDR